MLLPLLLCLMILYAPPLTGAAIAWPATAIGVAVLVLLNAAGAWAGSGLATRLQRASQGLGGPAANRILSLLKGAVVGFVLADVFVLKWPVLVAKLFASHPWAVLADDMLLLLPAVAMIVTVMACWHRFETRQGRVSLTLGRYVWLRFRVELAVILFPWLVLVLATDLTEALLYQSPHAGLAVSAATGGMLLLIVVFSPLLLRITWTSSPLPRGSLRLRLEDLCKRHHFRCSDILVWHTHRHLMNAGVVGPTALLRYVLLTDAMIDNCTEEEIEAVFAHEVGHIRHRHLAFYLLFALAFLCFYLNLIDLLALGGWVEPLGDLHSFELTARQAVAMLAFAGIYWVFIFGLISRRMEQQADLFSLNAIGNPMAFLSALGKLGAMSGTPRRTSFWRHFSIERRLSFLEQILNDPSKAAPFQLKIAAMQVALLFVFAAGSFRLLLARPELFGL